MSAILESVVPTSRWQETTLGELAEYITSGSRNWSKYYSDSGALFIRTQDINTNRLILDNVARVALPEKVEGKRTRVYKGDILITITGANVGKVALVDHETEEAYVSQSVALVRLKAPRIGRFIYHQLLVKSQGEKTHLEAMAYGLGRPVLNLDNIRNVPVRLAPLENQPEIVAEIEKQFSRLDEAVTNLHRVKTNLKRYKAAVLKAAVEGRLVETEAEMARREGRHYESGEQLLRRILAERRAKWEEAELAKMKEKGKPPKDDKWKRNYNEPSAPETTNLPELPEGWVWATVDQLGATGQQAVLTGPFGSNMGKADFQDTGVPVLTIGCLQETGLDISKATFVSEEKSEELARYKLTQGDMLFSRMASVGRADFVTQQFEGALFNYHIMRLRLECSVIESMLFIYYVRGSKAVRDYVREVNHGATRDGINTEQLLNMPVALPPVGEQRRIVVEVDCRLSVLHEIEAQVNTNLQRVELLRHSILGKAFSG